VRNVNSPSNNRAVFGLFSFEGRRKGHKMTQPLAELEENKLIQLALAGESECFGILINRHLGALKRCISTMTRNGTDADDLLQDVLLKVWRRLSTFRSESSFRTWMTRVAINEVLQTYRKEQRNPRCQAHEDLDEFVSREESPYRRLIRVEATKTVRSAVATLPEMYREVLILRDIEQFSTEETAQSIRATAAAVKTRLFRARLMLSSALRGSKVRGLASSGRKCPAGIRCSTRLAA